MISKIVEALKKDLLDFFNERNIVLTAKYSPELSGVSRYIKDYLVTYMKNPFASEDIGQYQNALLYKIGTPQTPNDKFNNLKFELYSKLADFNTKEGEIVWNYKSSTPDLFTITKIRDKSETDKNDGYVLKRSASYLSMPVQFMIMTESIDNLYDILLLLKQKIQYMNYLEVQLNLTKYKEELDTLVYYLQWDVDNLEIQYATFDENALNTLEFSCNIVGGYFSDFGTKDSIVDTIELSVGLINAKS